MRSIVTFTLLALLSYGDARQTPGVETVIRDGCGPAYFVRFSPNGRELARVCSFGPPMLFDTGSLDKARTFPVGLRMVAYSPDGTRIATAEGTDGARVWDAALPGNPKPNGLKLDLRVLEAPLQVLQGPSKDRSVRVFWTEFSPDGKHLLTTHANGHVKVWNASSWSLEADLALTDREVRAATFAPDSNSLVIGDADGVLHHWSLARKSEVRTKRTPLGAVAGVVFAPDGKTLVTTHESATGSGVLIWNSDTWTAATRNGFHTAAFSKDGKLLALGGDNIELIDARSQKPVRTIELSPLTLGEANPRLMAGRPQAGTKIPVSVYALAFSPDGATLAAGCRDGTVRLVKLNG